MTKGMPVTLLYVRQYSHFSLASDRTCSRIFSDIEATVIPLVTP